MADEKELLNLSTEDHVRPVVKIDGTPYPLALLSDWQAADRLKFRRDGLRLKAIWNNVEASDEEYDELQAILDRWTRRILPDAPPDVIGKLDSDQRSQVLLAFFAEAGLGSAPETSPASTDSTEEATETGS